MKKPPYRGSVNTGRLFSQQYWNSGSTVYNKTVLIESGSVSSVKTPNFRNLKKWQLPNNPFTYTYSLETRSEGSWSTADIPYFRKTEGYAYDVVGASVTGSWLAPPTADADAIAKNKLLKKLQGASINLAQSFAERKQTVNLIAHSVNRLASAALAIRRGNLKHASDLLGYGGRADLRKEIKPSPQNLSNYWLEYSYGWRPLLQDIYGSAEYLAQTFALQKPTVVSGSHTAFQQRFDYEVAFKLINVNTNSERAFSSAKSRVNYIVEYSEDSAFVARMASTGMSNPALLAWELIPYSFVVDWVLPIGTYLQNLQACNGLFFKRGCKTVTTSATHVTKWKVNAPNPEWERVSGLSRSLVQQTKSRTVLTSFPSPSPPTFRFPSQMSQVLSSLALLTQAFKR